MAGFFTRMTGLLIWMSATALTVFLVSEFTEGQGVVIIGLSLIAIMIGSFGLLHSRHAWRNEAKPEAIGGLVTWLLASSLLLFLELGYWSSNVGVSQEQFQDRQYAKDGVRTIMDRDRKALASGTVRESAAEIRANMEVQLSQTIGRVTVGTLTGDCRDITAAASRICGEYLRLKASLARAEAAEKIERRVWDAGTRTEVANVKRNLFAGADWMAKNIGGSADSWAFTITVLFVTLLWLARDGSLVIAFAPVRRQEARAAPKAKAAPIVADKASSPASEPHTKRSDLVLVTPPEDPRDPPPGGGKPDPIKERPDLSRKTDNPPSEKVVQPEAKQPAARLVVDNDIPPTKPSGKKKKQKRLEGSVIRWLDDATTQTPDKRVKATSQECRKSYIAWCEINQLHPVGHKAMSRVMSVELRKSDAGERGPRNGKGAVWPGLMVHVPNATPLKRRA